MEGSILRLEPDGTYTRILVEEGTAAVSIQAVDAVVGSGVGDIIKILAAPIAKILGKNHCTKCEASRVIANAYGHLVKMHGVKKATSLFKELWTLSRTDPTASIALLKQYLAL